MRRVIVVAYHFPPLAGSSGVQRTLRFVQHLPRFGWQPIVLTCRRRAYEQVRDDDLVADVGKGTVVERAFALDSARHLAIGGRYPGWLARPDRWISWWPGAVIAGTRLLAQHRPDAIFSTYPIATAHLIGGSLARRGRVPWVADFRDPMAQDGYPEDPKTWRSFKAVEERVFAHAAACTFTAPSALALYRDRYPDAKPHLELIENGYDEEAFAQGTGDSREPLNPGVTTVLHSGIVYPDERDPTQLFQALETLKARGTDGRTLRIRFRAAVHEGLLRELAGRHRVEDMIEVLPHAPYREALAEMSRADAVLVLQAANCNAQVPAKLYEYLRARRPLIAFTDARGDTAAVLRESGVASIASLDDPQQIGELLARFVRGERAGTAATEQAIARASRVERTAQLARLLDRVVGEA